MHWTGAFLFISFVFIQSQAVFAQSGRGALVETQIADEIVQPSTTTVQASIVAGMPRAVTATLAGRITLENLKIGQSIKAGDVIARLDVSQLDHQISLLAAQQDETANRLQEVAENIKFEAELTRIAEQQLRLLKTKAERASELARRSAISQDAAETTQSAYLNAQQQAVSRAKSMAALGFTQSQLELTKTRVNLQIARLETERADAVLKSPVDGQIVSLFQQQQGYARQGDVIAAIRTVGDYEIEADIPSRYLGFLLQAGNVSGRMSSGRPVDMSLRVVLPEENQRTGTRPVRLVANGTLPRGLRSVGAQLEVAVPISEAKPSVVISQDAIVPVSGGHVAFVFDEGIARRQVVRLGSAMGDNIVIEAGIAAGERVIIRGNEGLNDGASVREGKPPKRAIPSEGDKEDTAEKAPEIATELADDAKTWKLVWQTRRGESEAEFILSSGASLFNGEPVAVTREGATVKFAGELVLPFGILTLDFTLQDVPDSMNGKVMMSGLPNGNTPEFDVTGTLK